MITIEDCIAMCGFDEAEILVGRARAHSENIVTALGQYMLSQDPRC